MHPITEELKQIVKDSKNLSPDVIRAKLKEHVQDYILDFIYSSDYKNLIFYGGTCLRKVYGLDRMSEDLDFETLEDINLHEFSNDAKLFFSKELKFKDISSSVQVSNKISRITFKFNILKEVGLSSLDSENLHV